MELNVGHQIMDYVVAVSVILIGVGKGVVLLKEHGFFPSHNDNSNREDLKRVSDLTMESFETKVRHAVRGELQLLAPAQSETNRRLEEATRVLVRIEAILEQQTK